jgi:hypothetical protein
MYLLIKDLSFINLPENKPYDSNAANLVFSNVIPELGTVQYFPKSNVASTKGTFKVPHFI